MIKKIQNDKTVSIDKSWRILLEAALFEGRCGHRAEARKQFDFLLRKCRHNGPAFVEASKYEERENQLARAIDLCEEGLEHSPKCNPLWFQYLRLYEKADARLREQKFDRLNLIVQDLFSHISKEFHWKVHTELAQLFDRQGDDRKTEGHLRSALLESPESMKWKLWLLAARLLQNAGQVDEARLCIERACLDVPPKQVATALLEYAKYFEALGERERAL